MNKNSKDFNCDCWCCSNLNVCGIFRELTALNLKYKFTKESELTDAIGRACEYYKPNNPKDSKGERK